MYIHVNIGTGNNYRIKNQPHEGKADYQRKILFPGCFYNEVYFQYILDWLHVVKTPYKTKTYIFYSVRIAKFMEPI
jgi:hypothetical protein